MSLILVALQICELSSFESFLSLLKYHLPREAFFGHPPKGNTLLVILSLWRGIVIPVCLEPSGFLGCRTFCAKTRIVLGKSGKSGDPTTIWGFLFFFHNLCHHLILCSLLVCFLIPSNKNVSPMRVGTGILSVCFTDIFGYSHHYSAHGGH